MSRLAWAALLLAGAAAGLVFYLVTRPLPEAAQQSARQTASLLATRAAEFTEAEAALDAILATDLAYLTPIPELSSGREKLTAGKAQVAAAQALYDETVAPILDRDRHRDGVALFAALGAVAKAADGAVMPSPTPAEQAQVFVDYKARFTERIAVAEPQVAAAQAAATGEDPVATRLLTAATACPEAKPALERQQAEITKLRDQLAARAAPLEAQKTRQPPDYLAAGRLTDAIAAAHAAWQAAISRTEAALATLERSEDVILVDMKAEGGATFHQYQRIVDGVAQTGEWEPVSAADYAAHQDHLGMAISSKPACVLEAERITVPSPPGYAYVGNPRYGRWESRDGDRFWVFYGRYSLMRDLLWGPGYYRPISQTHWRDYDSARRSRLPWYGEARQFGSRGTRTRARYASSRHVQESLRAPAPRPTPAKSTGYSGSKYQGSSGSRSGGYKASRYRSRSFGGSGK